MNEYLAEVSLVRLNPLLLVVSQSLRPYHVRTYSRAGQLINKSAWNYYSRDNTTYNVRQRRASSWAAWTAKDGGGEESQGLSLISRYPVELSFRFNEADSLNDHDVAGDDRVPYGFTFRPLGRSVIVVKGEGSLVGLALSEWPCFSLSGDSTDDVLILEESATIMTLSDDSVRVVLIVGSRTIRYTTQSKGSLD